LTFPRVSVVRSPASTAQLICPDPASSSFEDGAFAVDVAIGGVGRDLVGDLLEWLVVVVVAAVVVVVVELVVGGKGYLV